jgi:UDP-3-O-[3-hydroxymyristoyl] N-acetylglucosamine deacetylase/3-hydroxyacyl-[acyl-carrier-protein] dehydratase
MSTTRRQRTLAREASVCGIGFLTGPDVSVRFLPAEPDTGVSFVRTDLPGRPRIPVTVEHVAPRQRRTTLETPAAKVEMVEHVLAALAGLKIDNCRIEIDACETPGCDGSSGPFVESLQQAGVVEQSEPRRSFVVDRPYWLRDGDAMLAIHPACGDGLVVSYNLDYGSGNPIGRQSFFTVVTPETFREELACTRTFLLEQEATALRAQGIGARTGPRDLLIFGPDGPIENRLRFPDEPVRHKVLDIVGDLSILGQDICGHVVAHKSGHRMNVELVRQLTEAARRQATAADAGPALDIRQISRILPHRYPFLLVDRVLELDPGRRAVGVKNVTINEPFFQGHWPGQPIMPGVMIIEAMAQLAGLVYERLATENDGVCMLLSMDNVKLRRPVVPGDQLVLEAESVRAKSRTFQARARALVQGNVAAEAEFRFVRIDRAAA